MAKVPPSEVFTRVFNDSPEFTESESDDENRSVIAKAIEKDQTNASTPTTSADPQPSPQPPVTSVSKPSEEINQESTSPPRETAESVMVAQTPEVITNIDERCPHENDVRNKLNFSSSVVKNNDAFTYKTRDIEKDLGTLLSTKISKIPILTDDLKNKIDNFKMQYCRGDVSFKFLYILKYLYYFQKSECAMNRAENIREEIERELQRLECPLNLSGVIVDEYNKLVQNDKELFIRFFDPKTKQVAIYDHEKLLYWKQGLTRIFFEWAKKLMPVMAKTNETVNAHQKENWTVIESKKFLLVLKIIQEECATKTIIDELIGLLLNNEISYTYVSILYTYVLFTDFYGFVH